MKTEINCEVDSITKTEAEKKDGTTESFRTVFKEQNGERSISLTSPEKNNFSVGEALTITLETPQKKITEFKK